MWAALLQLLLHRPGSTARILALELPPALSPKQRTNHVVSLGGIQLPQY